MKILTIRKPPSRCKPSTPVILHHPPHLHNVRHYHTLLTDVTLAIKKPPSLGCSLAHHSFYTVLHIFNIFNISSLIADDWLSVTLTIKKLHLLDDHTWCIFTPHRSSHLGIHKQTNACWSIPRSQTVFYHFKICRKWELWSLCCGALLPASAINEAMFY